MYNDSQLKKIDLKIERIQFFTSFVCTLFILLFNNILICACVATFAYSVIPILTRYIYISRHKNVNNIETLKNSRKQNIFWIFGMTIPLIISWSSYLLLNKNEIIIAIIYMISSCISVALLSIIGIKEKFNEEMERIKKLREINNNEKR